jgi:hypothetical protein
VALTFTLGSALATAQVSPADQAVAAALFDDGKKLLAAGRVDEACDKLAQSQKIEPLLGTLLNLARCHEQQGRTASAWIEFSAAAEIAGRTKDARLEGARERARALEAKLARLTVRIAARPEGLVVRLDGKDLGVAALGTAIPLDPGEHLVEVGASRKQLWSQKVVIPSGAQSVAVDVPTLADEAPAPAALPPPPPPMAPVAPVSPVSPEAPDTQPGRSTGRFVAGFVVGGVGVAGVIVGAAFGGLTFSKKGQIGTHCTSAGACDTTGYGLQQDAHQDATISTVAFAAGLAAVAAGTILVVTAGSPSSRRPAAWIAPTVGQRVGGATLGTSF